VRGAFPVILAGLLLIGASRAQAQASRADETQAPSIAGSQPSPVTDTGQISSPATASDVNTGQAPGPSHAASTAASQLSGTSRAAEAPAPVSTPAQGRNTSLTAVDGHDRCDAAARRQADRSGCDRIIEKRADEFASPPPPSPTISNPDTPAPDLVNDILNGGTGSVVALPPK
jgi:hypothetical protein